MGAAVAQAIRRAGIDPVVAVGGTAGAELGLVTVPDRWPGQGPLGALATVLRWARHGRVLLVPCDLPLLTPAVVNELSARSSALGPDSLSTAVVATTAGRPRHSVAVWPTAWAPAVRRLVERGERRLRSALDVGPWVGVDVPEALLADADTPADLKRITGN